MNGLKEHMDYEVGRYQNEHQAAFDLSRLTRPADDRVLINKLVALGYYVVAMEGIAYCRFTDAIIGSEVYCIAAYKEEDDAMAWLEANDFQESGYHILPISHEPAPLYRDGEEDDIPF